MDNKQDKTNQDGILDKVKKELQELCEGSEDVTQEKIDGWLKDAGLDKEITKKDTEAAFKKHVKGAKATGSELGKMMEELITKFKLDFQETLDKLKKAMSKEKSSAGRMPPKEDRPK